MLTIDQFVESCARETEVLKHLYTKLDSSKLDYSPGENQRNTLDLMRYLSWCGSGCADALINDDWSVVGKYQEAGSTMKAEEFPARLDAQLARIKELAATVKDSDLTKEVSLPWGVKSPLGLSLVELVGKFLAAYRLQLFSHVKTNGDTSISTHNAWLGIDNPEA